jgi:hypothetical protein
MGGNLYVADQSNNRVLLYTTPLTTNTTADIVYGQSGPSDFTGASCYAGGMSPASICVPYGVATDARGNLWVTEGSRMLMFPGASPDVAYWIADRVYGQEGTYNVNICNNPSPVTNRSLCGPRGVAVDRFGRLYVADTTNSRVLEYDRETGCPSDADCDGFTDAAVTKHDGPANTTTTLDNCIGVYNADQLNSDGNFFDNSPPYLASQDDKTIADSDSVGDNCDGDTDNDGMLDVSEAVLCNGAATARTSRRLADTDGDRFLDNQECVLGSDPANAASKPTLASCGSSSDTDGDRLSDRLEICFYHTSPTNVDTDGDNNGTMLGAKDSCEAASFNGDRTMNAGDQLLLGQEIVRIPPPAKLSNFDLNKDGSVNSGDQLLWSVIRINVVCP